MKRISLLVAVSIALSACSVLPTSKPPLLADLEPAPLKVLANSTFAVSHAEVLQHYQRYLDVSDDAEMRIRVANRMAALKLQIEELGLATTEDSAVDSNLALSAGVAAIKDYEKLLKDHPERADNDNLLYQLAKAYSLTGQSQLAIMALERLTTEHPRSSLYLESEFRLGQLLYASGDFEQASAAYLRLIALGRADNDYYLSAGYLLGWSLFKQQRNEDSLLAFTRVLDEEFLDEAAFDRTEGDNTDIRTDILRIMAVIFADMGDWQQVAQFYDQHGARFYEYKVYEGLASLYYQREFHRSAASTLHAFVVRYPMDKRAAGFYQRLIEGYQKARYANLMRRHQEEYTQRFGVGSEYWQAHIELRPELTQQLSAYIWELAGFYHGWGQSSKNLQEKQQRLALAARWYGEYVRSFPQAIDAVKAHFLLAEVSFELKDYPTACQHYEIVAYQHPTYEKAAEAGYAAILAYNAYQPSVEEKQAWRQATVDSALRFVQTYPHDARSGTVLVNTAELLLSDGHYQQALDTVRRAAAVEQDLPPRYRYGAALVHGHAAFELAHYAEAEQAIQQALAQKQADAKTQRDLRDKLAASIYRQGEQSKEQGDNPAAVEHWLRLGQVVPESSTKILAEYDAATLLMATADYPRAIEVMQAFRSRYPTHKLAADIPSKLIVAYEQQQNWQAAAVELKLLAQTSQDPEQQRIASYQAAEYFLKAKDYDNARELYRSYAHDYPTPFDAALEAHYQLDQIYAELGDEDKRRFWLDKIISLHNKAGNQQSDRSRYLAASAAFQLAEFERERFEKVIINYPLDKSILAKNNYLQAAQKRYTQAVQLNVLEFTTASTFHLGQLYADFSAALKNSERPKGLDELEQEEYEFLLEEQAFPLEETAIQIHQTNTGRSRDSLYDRWIRQSYASLAKLMPGQYNKTERVASYVDKIR